MYARFLPALNGARLWAALEISSHVILLEYSMHVPLDCVAGCTAGWRHCQLTRLLGRVAGVDPLVLMVSVERCALITACLEK